MRRLALVLLLPAVLALAGCAGGEGQRAQELLEQAVHAQEAVESATFAAELTVAADGQRFRVAVEGGGYLKGERAGDVYATVDVEGMPGAPSGLGVVVRDGKAFVSDGSGWRAFPLGGEAGAPGAAESLDPALVGKAMEALAASVEQVSVTEGQVFHGEPVAVVRGRIDTAKLFLAFASELAAAEGFPGAELFPVEELAQRLGDVHATLMLSERTGLVHGAVVSLRITGDRPGETAELRLAYRLTSVDEPVELPDVAG